MRILDSAGRTRRVRLLTPLAHRDFRILWIGMSVSLLGDGVLLVTLAWQVYTLSGSPSAMSVVGVALALPQIALVLVGGVVSDRCDRRKVMISSDLVRGACLATLAVLALTGGLRLWQVICVVAVYGAASGFFPPAFDATVPTLVPRSELVGANALDQFVRPTAVQIGGTALGGGLVAGVGPGWAFGFDALTFAFSAVCLACLRPLPPDVDQERASLWKDLRAGLSFVRANAWLWATFMSATFAYLLFLGPTEVLLPYMVKHVLHGSATELGLVLTSGGVSAILAAVIVGQAGLPGRFITFMYWTWSFATLGVAGYGLATSSWQLALTCAVVNGLETAGIVAWATAKQRLVPAALLGRVSSVDWFVSLALLPLSYALAAPVAAAVGVRATFVGAGVIGAVVTLAFLYLPGVRAVERDRGRDQERDPS
ncbi:MFS transporter [Streptomyces sp. 11x1]|uniref:MFS transporter n=1 Tax=Streptomyces sp. 11x1 TaxID=3038642 RepID=UPI0029303589|nr:MFS transporter [Streptomyces sp. 11x1]WNZ11808.1 MFS transporter [Streptomyces sp. 11x1]